MNPRILANTLIDLTERKGKSAVALFVRFLESRSAIHMLPSVVRELEKRGAIEKSEDKVSLSTSHAVSEKTIKDILSWIEAPQDIETDHKVDEELMGGFEAMYKNKLYDASLKTKIDHLKKTLITNGY